jgi:hypothetical protein
VTTAKRRFRHDYSTEDERVVLAALLDLDLEPG